MLACPVRPADSAPRLVGVGGEPSRRILITGAQGQLGRALQAALACHEVAALGRGELDVTDPGQVAEAIAGFRPQVVVHAAAWTDTRGCEGDPERALLVNGTGSRHVAEACASAGGRTVLVYVSSNEVFDGEKSEPYGADEAPNPINHYGRSKLEGERQVQAVLDRYYIVRTAWLYGAGRTSFPEKMLQAAREQGRLRLVTDEVASPTWTVDLARALARLIELRPAWGVYHLTNSGHCSRLEWAREVLRLAGLEGMPLEPTTLSEFGAPYRKPAFTALSLEKARRLGIEMPPWQDALERYIRESR